MAERKTYLDKDGLPTRTGTYLVLIPHEDEEPTEIDVYYYRPKGLCCFVHDYGGDIYDGVDDQHNCHVSI